MALPWPKRVDALRDADLRARLIAEADQPAELSGPLAPKDPAKLYLLPPGVAAYDVGAGQQPGGRGRRRGTTPAGAFLDFLADTDGLGLLYYPVLNQDLGAVAAMLVNPDVIVGVADAGAHVALTMDAGQTSFLLSHWVRDQALLDVGRAVHKLTQEPAQFFGLEGRGVLEVGAFADVNVLDLDRLQVHTPEIVEDFPLGASRYVQRATGYDYTLVNGQVLVDHDELTTARAGTVVSPA